MCTHKCVYIYMWNYVCLLDYMLVYLHVAVYSYIVLISIHLIIFSYRSISWSLLSTLIETKGQSLNLLNLPLNVPAALGWNLHLPWAHLHLEVLIQLPDGLWWWWLVVAGGGWWWLMMVWWLAGHESWWEGKKWVKGTKSNYSNY